MIRYILRRTLFLIPVMLGVSFIVFSLIHFTPGDAAVVILGESAPPEAIEALRAEMGLNDPFLVQYGRYVFNVVTKLDFGSSYVSRRPVFNEIIQQFPNTIKLAALAVTVAIFIGIPAGVIAATHQNKWIDNVTMFFSLLGVSMPIFWQGILLILVFSLTLQWLPSSGFNTWQQMILPSLTLSSGSAAIIARMTRSSMLEVYRQDYVRTARSKGLKERIVVTRHALKNALIPIVTVIGLQFGFLLGGAVLTESIFGIPGLGRLMVNSIRTKDMMIIQGGVLLIAITFSIINLFVDVLYAYLDPRIRSQYK